MFKKLSSKTTYKNQWMEVFEDAIEFEDGSQGIYGYMQRANGVVIAVLDAQRRLLLINEYRYPIQGYQWTLPGGGIDEGEDAAQAAIRELAEETGLKLNPDQLRPLTTLVPLSSGSTETETIFICELDTEPELSDEEMVDESFQGKRFISLETAKEMVLAGAITDAVTAAVILQLAQTHGS